MKKILKYLGYFLLLVLLLVLGVYVYYQIKWSRASAANMKLLGPEAPALQADGQTFRDLNKNGRLDIYEDRRQDIEARIDDLIGQMNIQEKAGLMFITITGMHPKGRNFERPVFSSIYTFFLQTNSDLIANRHMNHFNTIQSYSPQMMAKWHNAIQKMAERTRLGIPVTIATDPRHGSAENPGANIPTPCFSQWPSGLGLAATRDSLLIREFGDIGRQEYLAVGIRQALHPMADLATEPRWGRINGTFGEDARLSAKLTYAYIKGFQGDSLGTESVACMSKHFSGGGPQKDGEDPHFPYGKEQVYPGNNFDYHLIPFEQGAFPAGTSQIMPYYGIPMGQTSEDVAFAFNKDIITGMLREKYHFEGVICTDWNLMTDGGSGGAKAWGVENLSRLERTKKILDAGCDMFGGESAYYLIVELVESGEIPEARIDESVRRILRDKFRLGLFDNPYVDEEAADNIVGQSTFVEKGKEAQRKSLVLLKNEGNLIPLAKETKVYAEGFDKRIVKQYFKIVSSPTKADIILVKSSTPYDKRTDFLLERFFRQGRLDFPEDEKQDLLKLLAQKPSILVMTMDRPPIIPDINAACHALIADFQTQDDAILDSISGKFPPSGKLPFEIPSSIQAVEQQHSDVPYDSENPLYGFGAGM